jgi:hypothetical protein
VRRLFCLITLAVVAGTVVPATAGAAVASAATAAARRQAASPGPQRFGVRLVDVPVSEAHNPRGLRYIIDYLPAGSVIHRRIMVLNQESHRAHFTVYPDAARIRAGYFIGAAGHTRNELTSWIHIAHPSVTLAAHSSVMDMVTIRVPRRATRGEHYGVIWVQQTARARTPRGFTINEVARVGIRIYLAVGRGGAPPTSFAITGITGRRTVQGRPELTADVHNTGGRAVDLDGSVRLTDGPGGTSAGPFRVYRIITLAPGQTYPVTFYLGRRLPSGPWRATVTLASGFTKRSGSATVLFGGRLTASAWSRPGTMAVLGALALAIPALVAAGVRRRIRSPRRAPA